MTDDTQREAFHHLCELVDAMEGAFISSWQSTAAWQKQLDAAADYVWHMREQEDKA